VEVDGQMRLACVEGPEFDGHKVNFDLLMERLHSYQDEEMQALEVHGITEIHQCKMEEEARKKEREMVLE
jgi:ferredoxin--NADP+ reductase